MGAYGDDVSGGSYSPQKKSYEEEEPDYDTRDKFSKGNKSDPFDWGDAKPKKAKYSPDRRKEEAFEDTGYDGWNDVKR